MSTQSEKHYSHDEKVTEREGIVVWDQNGLVVLWPDGHCSRFSWSMLRQACHCAECRKLREGQTVDLESRFPETTNAQEESVRQVH